MFKFVRDFICLLSTFAVFEIIFYIKDYNEIKVLENYIRYEIETKKFVNIDNEKYSVDISFDREKIRYEIIYERNTIFNFKFLKKIRHHGII